MLIKNQRGQSLIEYLIIVALVGVGSIAIMRTVGQSVYVRFANIADALQGRTSAIRPDAIQETDHQKKGLDDFMNNSGR